ncbi:MAG: hypothetical protein K1X74_18470 [Pirellulales bacterium]|nr:hypothetical protein [Pirellulales bacterium]
MNRTAEVKSLAALEAFRSALCLFREDADQALVIVRAEVQNFLKWLKHEQVGRWQREVRVREERVIEAKNDLHRCMTATIDPNRTPSCLQEKKVLAAAKRALEQAEETLAAVRRWLPIVEQAASDYFTHAETLAAVVSIEVPDAIAHLDRILARLNEYLAAPVPGTEIPQPAERSLPNEAQPTLAQPGAPEPVAAKPADAEEQEL